MRSAPRRGGGHGLFQYPAMMVPELQGALLDDLITADPDVGSVLDPFVGSGTVMLETLRRGLAFRGTDVNPMAGLLCAVKSAIYDPTRLEEAFASAMRRARRDEVADGWAVPVGLGRWFSCAAADALERLGRSVRSCDDVGLRRAMWVCLAETVRLTSDSRTSTVKLHRRPENEIASRIVDPLATFRTVAREHVAQLTEQSRVLALAPGAIDGCDVRIGDARTVEWGAAVDVVMTSPPYGDNLTTIAYGQHSYLPLRWIDHADIPGRPDPPANAYRCDRESLGGRLTLAPGTADALRERSPAFSGTLDLLAGRPANARSRLTAFFRDLDDALGPVVAGVRPSGWVLLTLGDRRISGVRVPTVAVVRELLGSRALRAVTELDREIPFGRKRMASRNSISDTMTAETILIMRTPGPRSADVDAAA